MKLNDCGCGTEDSPTTVHNDPGLDAISVRVGDFARFKAGMHAALGAEAALAGLTTRDDADPALAVVDAWAATLDVLTFYNDRIANESYLRTATEPRSILELAREVGYRPAPATAALADLAFKMDASGHGPASVRIDAGTKVQSQPGQDELPQTFETLETIVARPEWNAIPVASSVLDSLSRPFEAISFAGRNLGVKVGDALLFVANDDPGDGLLVRVTEVTPNDALDATRIAWAESIGELTGKPWSAFHMRYQTAVFGHNSIDPALLPTGPNAVPPPSPSAEAPLPGDHVDLDAVYPSIAAGSWALLRNETGTLSQLRRVVAVSVVVLHEFYMSGKVTRLTFGPAATSTVVPVNLAFIPPSLNPRNTVVFAGSEPLTVGLAPRTDPVEGNVLDLSGAVSEPGRSMLIVGKRPRALLLRFGPVRIGDPVTPPESVRLLGGRVPEFSGGGIIDYVFPALKDDGSRVTIPANIPLTLVPARDDDPTIGERVVFEEDNVLTTDLQNAYERASAVVYGNVARASHGETRTEVLGSGNAAKPFQSFDLSFAPLTTLPAATPSGSADTLELRVDGVLWHEADTLLDLGPRDRAYTARPNATNGTTATFGSGTQGARLPTGIENVAARYRVGGGIAGRVRSGQLKTLLSRPLGVTDVANPLPATGGSDAEAPDETGRNVPRFALTLGRVVSLGDFSDAATRLPGVAKAQATLLWQGDEQAVFVTVSGPGGSGADVTAVAASLDAQRDTQQRVVVTQAETLTFRVAIDVIVREDYDSTTVLAELKAVLLDAFGFDGRDFAQAVTTSAIAAAAHRVPGVLSANVTTLSTVETTLSNVNRSIFFRPIFRSQRPDVLTALPARSDGGTLMPAQILIIDPQGIALSEVPRDV